MDSQLFRQPDFIFQNYIMESKNITLDELTSKNVNDLTEENVFYLLNTLICEFPREERPQYVNIISTAFDFRSIGSGNRTLKNDLEMSGYKFFQIPYNKKLIMGVKRKKKLI